MRVYRQQYRDRDGNLRTPERHYVEFRDHQGVKHNMSAFRDKGATETLARKLVKLASLKSVGEPLGGDMVRFIEDLPDRIRRNLVKWGMVDEQRVEGGRPLSEHVKEFKHYLEAKGNTPRHCKQQHNRVKRIIDECGFHLPRDLDGGKIQTWLHDEVERGTFGVKTRNHYLTAMKTFCRWLVRERRLAEDPTRFLSRRNAAPDVRHERRALSADECEKLLSAAREGKTHHGLSGPDRALCYRLALETGLRYSELRSLTVGDLNLQGNPPTVTVQACYSKSGREDTLPLRQQTAAKLRQRYRRCLPGVKLFSLWGGKGAPMIRKDLDAAGIPYRQNGRVADFHSLRHTFITRLAESGVHPKTAQALARHSTITLTLDHYTHSVLEGQAEAVGKLPELKEREEADRQEGGA